MVSEPYRRKIQLIAGVTYTVSLPKQWVKKNGLKDKGEIMIQENSDGTLAIAPHILSEKNRIEHFDLDIDAYPEDIERILFALYYLGAKTINVCARKEMAIGFRSKVKLAVSCMAGTEIMYEDQRQIRIAILLNLEKVNINQVYFRVVLLIKNSIDALVQRNGLEEVDRSEEEIDRLYHLISKIITMSQTDVNVLTSSGINNTYNLSPYLLIAKKLESIHDSIFRIAQRAKGSKECMREVDQQLALIREKLDSGMSFFMNRERKSYMKDQKKEEEKNVPDPGKIPDPYVSKQVYDMVRYLDDIDHELTHISFFAKLVQQKII